MRVKLHLKIFFGHTSMANLHTKTGRETDMLDGYNHSMPKPNRIVIIVLAILSVLVFCLFCVPNSKGSENMGMVTMFEPDEARIYLVIDEMTTPKASLKATVGYFFAYNFYSYGFPFFAPSALVFLGLKLLGVGGSMPAVMLWLRQIISVLPMLIAAWILVYMQDGFRTWRSVLLFCFLVTLPALVQNGFWWHPDGLVVLAAVLVLFCLWKDQRRFGKHFFLAAFFCGILIALKLIGFFFFLAIGMTLVWGLVEKKLSWKRFFTLAVLFIAVMAVSVVIGNPYLVFPSERADAWYFIQREMTETSQGYGVTYPVGLRAAWPTMHAFYGQAVFLLVTLGVTAWGIWKKEERFLYALTLAWFIPLSVYLMFFSHFKYQYWLPVALPMLSNLILLVPEKKTDWPRNRLLLAGNVLLLVLIGAQMAAWVRTSAKNFTLRTNRAKDNPAIIFYNDALETLEPVRGQANVYFDYRLYMPGKDGWRTENSFDLLTYDFINSRNFDLLFLSQQRIRDYLNPEVTSQDAEGLEQSRVFYRDADTDQLQGYYLLLREDVGLLYIRDGFCQQYYGPEICQ